MDKIDYSSLEVVISIFFLFFLSFFALFEAVLHRLSSFDLKLLSDQHRDKKNIVIHLLAGNDLDVIIPLKFGIQLAFIIIAILTTHIVLINITYLPLLWAFGIMFVIDLVFRQLIPHIVSHKNPDKKLLSLLPLFSFFFPTLKILSYPISLAVQTVEDAETTPEAAKSKEVVKKEIQALIDIGKEEEVFEKEEGELVRSVLEFGDTKAREVMTPRSKIVAVQDNATIEEVRELMVQEKHSRIPVYRENLDQIVGLIYVRHLLTKCEEGKG
ncbi:MAG: CNNM domain-containing protein, partial [Pseudomonadota bacterium]